MPLPPHLLYFFILPSAVAGLSGREGIPSIRAALRPDRPPKPRPWPPPPATSAAAVAAGESGPIDVELRMVVRMLGTARVGDSWGIRVRVHL